MVFSFQITIQDKLWLGCPFSVARLATCWVHTLGKMDRSGSGQRKERDGILENQGDILTREKVSGEHDNCHWFFESLAWSGGVQFCIRVEGSVWKVQFMHLKVKKTCNDQGSQTVS